MHCCEQAPPATTIGGLKTALICFLFLGFCGSDTLDDPLVWVFWLKISGVAKVGANSKASLLKYLARGLGRREQLESELLGLCRHPSV